ncbi:MAG: aminotransferase class V-fold PLP-dependent enzyme [Acidobacteriota bacterium]
MNDTLRALFPVTERAIYLNHAAVSAPPLPTIQAIESYLADVSENGSIHFRNWLAVKESARGILAGMLGSRPEQVAFVRNTSDGLSTVANGYTWLPGDNIVTFRNEFPSNIYPWLRVRDAFGVEVRKCEERDGRVDPEELIGLMDGKTRLVSISHVQYATGFRADIERIGRAVRSHDALLVVDVIQSLGVVPLDVQSQLIDVAAGACHKWLLTPEGVGFLYLSDRARERIQPTLVGWVSVPNPDDYNDFEQGWNKGTLAWESGTGPAGLIHGLNASLKLLTETGVPIIQDHLETLTDYLCERLKATEYRIISSRRPGEKSQIVSIRHTGGLIPMDLFTQLKQMSIITAPRGQGLRIAPHLYNTLEEMGQLVDALP